MDRRTVMLAVQRDLFLYKRPLMPREGCVFFL